MIVYSISNKITNKIVYIGQSVRTLTERWQQHLRDSKTLNYPIYRAIRKYGKENFEVFVIEKCKDIEELNYKESELIVKHNTLTPNGYNLKEGGRNGKLAQETIEKIRKCSVTNGFGKWKRSEEDNLKNRERALKQHSDPVKHRINSVANGSVVFKVFEAVQVRPAKRNQSAIYEKGNCVGQWLTATDCARNLGIKPNHIRSCLVGKRSQAYGFIFERIGELYGK